MRKRESKRQWIERDSPDVSVPEEFKNNSNLQYIDIARLFFTHSKLQEWVGKINEFARANPDTVHNTIPIELEEPEFSDSELNEEYECYKRNYGSSPPRASTPEQHPTTREWIDISFAEMEIFLGICFKISSKKCQGTDHNDRNTHMDAARPWL